MIHRRSQCITQRSLIICLRAIALLLLCGFIPTRAQEDRHPQRGFNPGNSYSFSEIETINMVNGNLGLSVPLGSLPAGRGGSPGFTLGLTYNSKSYDSHVETLHNSQGQPESVTHLNFAEDGGWRYTFPTGYERRVLSRRNEEPSQPCDSLLTDITNYRRNSFIWKMQVIYPDGSAHEFRPVGFNDDFNDGFFDISPNGWLYQDEMYTVAGIGDGCTHSETLVTTAPMVYYSTDGSYTRLVVEHNSDPADHVGAGNQWTLFFPDGGRVTNQPNQRVYDRNNHYFELIGTTLNNHPATKIIDELGRFIIREIDSQSDPLTGAITRQDYVYVKGTAGEEMRWTIRWKQIYVYKQYRATVEMGGIGRGNTYPATWEGSLLVIDQITLPSQAGGLTYEFGYNAGDYVGDTQQASFGWGELNSVTLPSGAKASYTYGLEGVSSVEPTWKSVLKNRPKQKQLRYRQEYDLAPISNSPCDLQVEACTTDVWTYSAIGQASLMTPHTTSITGPDGGVTIETIQDNPNSPFNGRTLVSIHSDGTKIENLWRENRAPGMIGGKVNPFIKTVFTSIKGATGNYVLTATKDYDFDKNGNVTRLAEYDWVAYSSVPPTGPPLGIAPKRITANSYYAATPDALNTTSDDPDIYIRVSAPQLLTAVQSAEVGDGGTQPLARSEVFYDNPNTTGNPTERRTWDSQKGGYSNPLSSSNSISVINEYDPQVLGKLTQTTNPRGFRTEYTYGLINGFTDLYPTETRMAAGTNVQRRMTAEYDFHTGLVTRATDSDNNVSTLTSYDVFGRTVLVRAAEGRPEETQTSTQYLDSERRVVVRLDLDLMGDGKLASIQHYDQLGRVRLARQLEEFSAGALADETIGIKVQTRYLISNPCQPTNDPQCLSDNGAVLGSYVLTSNPYRAATSAGSASESTMGWARARIDRTGRAVELKTLAGNSLPEPWGGNLSSTGAVTTVRDGEFTTVTDQSGKIARSKVDALGRLVRVDEPSDGNNALGQPDTPTQATNYEFDALGNLKLVTQGAQTRTFNYSSLSLLKDSSNPESGTISYEYDENGNLTVKTDPRLLPNNTTHISTTFEYDALNRPKSRTYNDGTPNVTYTYDTPGDLARGRLTGVSSTVSAYSYGAYDALGRVKAGTQTTDGQAYTTSYSYNRVGAVVSQTYPSGRVVKTEYDPAGRIAGAKNDGNGAYYAGGNGADAANRLQYSSNAAVQAMKLGNGLWEHTNFNSRLQATQLGLGFSISDSSKLKLDYTFGVIVGGVLDATKNNGNVQSQTITLPGTAAIVQNYDYDELNRLKTAQETGVNGWTEQFSYDRFGNRIGITIMDNPNVRLPSLAPEVSSGSNRLKLVNSQNQTTGYDYDLAGNLTQEPETGSAFKKYSYDAENHMTQAKRKDGSIESDIATYHYDAGGGRVKTVVGSVTTIYVYSVSGQMIAEYADTAINSSGTSYVTSDLLGSTRVVTGGVTEVKERHDYLPFGEEIPSAYNNRFNVAGYGSDKLRQKFTQKERDLETGLDYFGARYYSSTQGRFTGVDIAGPDLMNPQSLNKYAYTLNNPLRYVDPKGLYEEDVHLQLTYALGMAAGFTARDAWNIALGDQGVDDDPNRGPFAGVKARRLFHFTTPERRDQLWGDFASSAGAYTGPSNNNESALDRLGTFLHAQQDSYSHEDFGPVLGQAWPPTTGSKPDKTYNDPEKADKMAFDTYNHLTTAATVLYNNHKISFLYSPLEWKVLSPLVQAFNRARTPEEKQKIVNQIKTLAQQNLERQAQEAIMKKQEAEKKKKRK